MFEQKRNIIWIYTREPSKIPSTGKSTLYTSSA